MGRGKGGGEGKGEKEQGKEAHLNCLGVHCLEQTATLALNMFIIALLSPPPFLRRAARWYAQESNFSISFEFGKIFAISVSLSEIEPFAPENSM